MPEQARQLAGEMGLTPERLAEWLGYYRLGREEQQRLRDLEPRLRKLLPGLADDFYQHLLSFDEARGILTDSASSGRHRQILSQCLERLISGSFDFSALLQRLEVGITHERVGIAPMLFAGAYASFFDRALPKIAEAAGDETLSGKAVRTFLKTALFDLVVILAAYFHAKEKQLRLANQEVAKLNRIYWVLSEINGLIVRESNRERLLEETCRVLVEAGGFKLAWVGMVGPASKEILPRAAFGATGYLEELAFSVDQDVPAGRGPLATALRNKRLVIVDDLAQDPSFRPWRERAARFGFKAAICLPLRSQDRVMGVLSIYAGEQQAFGDGEIALLEEIADDLSLGLEHIRKEEEIQHLLFYDQLTGLGNREYLLAVLAPALAEARFAELVVLVMMLDIDRFNSLNHALGYARGDQILVELGRRLRELAGEHGAVARTGPDEFGLFTFCKDPAAVAGRVEELERLLAEPLTIDGEQLNITASLGLAVCPTDGREPAELLDRARAALTEAQRAGASQIRFYNQQLSERAMKAISLERQLRQALEQGQFELYFQPKIGLRARDISGIEALIRWHHPEEGLVAPGRFIPVLEETGLIEEVGRWVAGEACRVVKGCTQLDCPLSFNVSPRQFIRPDFAADLIRTVESSGAAPARMRIEITESALMTDVEAALEKLAAIRAAGMSFSIDDFGTGYSSLAYLKKIPASTLKIDMSFVRGLPDNRENVAITRAIIDLAKNLGMSTVAEGVETREQLVFLSGLGVNEVQGYYFARPMPLGDCQGYIRDYQPERYFWPKG